MTNLAKWECKGNDVLTVCCPLESGGGECGTSSIIEIMMMIEIVQQRPKQRHMTVCPAVAVHPVIYSIDVRIRVLGLVVCFVGQLLVYNGQ
jgi:hypothetical protein